MVRFVLRLQSRLSRWGLADILYVLSSFPIFATFRLLVMARNRIDVVGRDRLPPKGTGFFLLSNHISMAEGPTVACLLWPRPFWFPAKAEFYRSWIRGLGWLLLTGMRTFPVRRGERDGDAISLMEQVLHAGDSVLLFPEGTRSRDGALQPGKKGVGMIIHNARPVVVPVYVQGFERIWQPGRRLPWGRRQRARVVFGEPLDLDEFYAQPFSPETGQRIADAVMNEIARLKAEAGEPV